MQPKDWIAVAALLLSLVSLGCSIATFRFNRRVKLVELRASFLKRASEFTELRRAFKDVHAQCIRIAQNRGDGETIGFLTSDDFGELLKEKPDDYYADALADTNRDSLAAYERRYHQIERLTDRQRAAHQRMLDYKAKYEAKG